MLICSFIYTEEVDITSTNALLLLYAARKYMLSSLVNLCQEQLAKTLKIDNVCTVLEQSRILDLPDLKSQCISFIGQNTREVVKTENFFQLSRDALEEVIQQDWLEFADESEVYKACVMWARKQLVRNLGSSSPTDEQIRGTLGNVLSRIRFPTMKQTEFAELVGLSNVLTLKEKNDLYFYIATARGFCGSHLRFDSHARHFLCLTMAVKRFANVSKRYVFIPRNRTVAIDFVTSFDTSLTAVGLYGGKEPYTHDVKIKVYQGLTVLRLSPTSVSSDGSETPVKVPLDSPVTVHAGVRYTVSAKINGSITHRGCDGMAQVPLMPGRKEMVSFFNSDPERFNDDETNVLEGQIPVLYFWTRSI